MHGKWILTTHAQGFTPMLVHRMHAESRLVTCESKGLQLPAVGNLTTLLALRPVTSLLPSARPSGWDRFRAEAQGEMFSCVTRVAASGGGDRRPETLRLGPRRRRTQDRRTEDGDRRRRTEDRRLLAPYLLVQLILYRTRPAHTLLSAC